MRYKVVNTLKFTQRLRKEKSGGGGVRILNRPFHITDTAGALGRRGNHALVPPPKHLAKDETRHIY